MESFIIAALTTTAYALAIALAAIVTFIIWPVSAFCGVLFIVMFSGVGVFIALEAMDIV